MGINCRLLEQVRQEKISSGNSSPHEQNGGKNFVQNLSTKRMRVDESDRKICFSLSSSRINSNTSDSMMGSPKTDTPETEECNYQCLAVNISPELGERVCLSGERALIEEVFPEISQNIMDSSKVAAAWNQDDKHVIRFPLNGFCKLNSLQTIVRLLNNGFRVMASNGGGVEGQQFSEYLMVRKCSL